MGAVQSLVWVGLGGALGAVVRYQATLWLSGIVVFGIPFSTLVVNVMGSFCIGLLMAGLPFFLDSDSLRLFLSVGLLGSLTTFSTFSFDVLMLLQQGLFLSAILTILFHNILGIGMAIMGYVLLSGLISV